MVLLKSIIVGILAIFPGVSGSAIAISFNLYDRFFLSLRNIKKNKGFLLLFLFGLIIGLFIGSNILLFLTDLTLLYYCIIGIILSEIPFIIKKVRKTGKILYIPLIISFLLSLLSNLYTNTSFNDTYKYIKMFFGGILFSFGKIFPGVSSSCFLISLGLYKDILLIFANPLIIINSFLYYLPFIIGVLIGLIIFIKLLSYLIKNKYNLLYSMMLGFILSSIFMILPKFSFNVENILGIILSIISFVISFKIKKSK